MTDAPDRILVEDERPEGGTVHVTDAARLSDYRPDFGNWYLLETPARLHAEELAEALREALEELDEYYRAEYDTDHPYHQDKLARARAYWDRARALLARIEGEASK